jgi:hypothetical protein
MLNSKRAVSTATKQRHSSMHRSLLATVVAVIGAAIVMPSYSMGAPRRSYCSSAPVTTVERCHFDLNDRMKMALGSWGNGVHPSGPNFLCAEHQRQLEAQNRACR